MKDEINCGKLNLVLMIDGFGHGGIQQAYLLLLNEYLEKFNSVILIIAQKSNYDLMIPKSKKLTVINLHSIKLLDLSAVRKLRKLFREIEPKYIICNMYRSQIWSALARTKFSKLIWVEQNTYINRTASQWLLMRILAKKVDKIVCISEDVWRLTTKHLKQKSITTIIPNPIRNKFQKIDIYRKNNDFIFVARMVPQKNPQLMLRSFATFVEQYNINSKLHLVGDGELLNQLKELSITLGIADRCIFHGWIDNTQIHELMNKCKTLVSTSLVEGMALVRLEALANGCCVVSTETGGARQYLMPDNHIGTFITHLNEIEISRKMYDSLNVKYWSGDCISSRIALTNEFNPTLISYKLIYFN